MHPNKPGSQHTVAETLACGDGVDAAFTDGGQERDLLLAVTGTLDAGTFCI